MMSNMRPEVFFDPTQKEHRMWFNKFIVNNTWANCPYRFRVPGVANTLGVMQRMMLEYYANKELKIRNIQ